MSTKAPHFPDALRRKLIVYAALSLLLMGICAGLAVGIPLLSQWKQMENMSLRHRAELKATAVAEWLRQNRHIARQLAARTGMRQELEALNKGTKRAHEAVLFITGAIEDSLRQSSDVVGITRLNDQGQIVASGGVPIPQEMLSLPEGDKVRVRVSPPLMLGGQQCLLLAAPIRNREDVYIGSDVMAVSTAPLLTLLQNASSLGMMRAGTALWFKAVPQDEAILWDSALIMGTSAIGGVLETKKAVLAHVPVPDTPWALVLPADPASLYAPAWSQVKSMAATMTVVYLLCLGGFILVSRPLAGKILLHTHELESSVNAKTIQLQNELQARIQAEAELQKARDLLERRVEQRTRSLAEANVALQKEQEQRMEVARELINLLEKVRSEISRDLHDHTGQLLTTLRLSLENTRTGLMQANPENNFPCVTEAASSLHEAGHTVKTIQQTLKSIAKGLRPPCLDYLGLVPALDTLLEEYRHTGLRIFFFHKDIPDSLDNEKGLALYRIAQEALTNVLRHSRASTVHVSFTCQAKKHGHLLTLSLEDDGQGFEAEQVLAQRGPVERLGLTLMQERMILLGGECVVESTPGKGTQVMAQVELQGDL